MQYLPQHTQEMSALQAFQRKLCYKGHYMYVRPANVLVALQWLKSNNSIYKDIEINSLSLASKVYYTVDALHLDRYYLKYL